MGTAVSGLCCATAKSEHRTSTRFPIETEIRYTFKRYQRRFSGVGRTLNISSGGILFWSRDILPVGGKIEIRLAWPARINGVTELYLWIDGETVRTDGQHTAVRIQRHEFRVHGHEKRLLRAIRG